MNDLEMQLQDALDLTAEQVPVSEDAWLRNEQLLHELPRRRSPSTWVMLATAACVIGVLVAVAVLALPGGHKATPAAPPTPTPSPTLLPSPTATPTSPGPTSGQSSVPTSVAPGASNIVSVGGATLTLPGGWVAEAIPGTAQSGPILHTWCLMPTAGPAPGSQNDAACTISFSAVDTGNATEALSVDTEGGLVSNPEYCGVGGGVTNDLLDYSDTYLGTRPADHRRWLFVCRDGSQVSIEQYVADNAPGYVLFSSHATAGVHGIMAEIARTAKLPEISSPLRLSDFGILRSVEPIANGYHVQLDRVVQGIGELINNNPQTYAYDIPAAILNSGYVPKVGDKVLLQTNGEVVTSVTGGLK
jgi:hypothetical protein